MHAHTMTVATQHGQARLTTPPSHSSWNLSLSDADPAAADVSRVRSACAIMLPGIIPCSPASALSLLLSPGIRVEPPLQRAKMMFFFQNFPENPKNKNLAEDA